MGAFYGNKIRNNEMNSKTGEIWKLGDVPSLWKAKTEQWLSDN